MTLTPREIQEKQFHDAFRGYSHEEVDLFIDQVAEAYDQIYRENQTLRRRVEELESLADGRPAPEFIPAPVTVHASTAAQVVSPESEDMLKRVLMTAQESADKAVQNARARAQALIEEAEAKARRIEEQSEAMRSSTLEDAQRRASETLAMAAREEAELKERIEGLRMFERDFRTRLSAFVKSQLELLEAKPLITSAAPLTTWDRPKASVFDSPAPQSESSWLSLGDKSGVPDTPTRLDTPLRETPLPETPLREERRRDQPRREALRREVEARDVTPVPEPAPDEAAETAKAKSKVENRSIRELFWGDD